MRVPFAVLVLCLGPTLVLGQALGDAARRQAVRRAANSSATAKTYTDADLHSASHAAQGALAVASPPPTGKRAPEDAVRAQLDREAEHRRQQESLWRNRAREARAHVDAARRDHDAACGPGVLVLTGG